MTISLQDIALLHEISSPASLSLRPQHLQSRLHGKVLHKKSIRVLRSHILGDLRNRIIRQLLKLLILTLQHKRYLRIHQTLGLHEICPLAQTEKWKIHFSNSAAEWRYLPFLSAWRTAHSLPLKQKKKEKTSWEFLDTNQKTQFITEHETRRQRKKKFPQPSPSLSSLASSSSTTGASPDISPPLTLCVSPPPQSNFISRQIYWFLTRFSPPYCFRIITAPKQTSK